MVGQGDFEVGAGLARRQPEQRLQRAADHRRQRTQQGIARRVEDGAMELEVGGDPFVDRRRRGHRLVSVFDVTQLCLVSLARGERRRRRLDDLAHLVELQREARLGRGRAAPGEHIGVEQIPARAGSHAGADARARLDEALGREHLDRLAQGGAAHAELAAQLFLVGQCFAGRAAAADDAPAELVHHLAVQVAARISAGAGARWLHHSAMAEHGRLGRSFFERII